MKSAVFAVLFCTKTDHLPRQARDRHMENSKMRHFCRLFRPIDEVEDEEPAPTIRWVLLPNFSNNDVFSTGFC
jgi:hypothetical protein|eukprot:COSAG06_NODE_182_length_20899_cov_89.175048_8_plen_73_part_00